MMSLFLRNLFFTLVQPGIVAVLIPFFIVRNNLKTIANPFAIPEFIGTTIFVSGFIITVLCIAGFAVKGKGTLSPLDPTKKLVTTGLYRFSRNPMYVGVLLMLLGESVFFTSWELFVYGVAVFFAFHFFVRFFEEPRLKKDFGKEYSDYSNRVPRWI